MPTGVEYFVREAQIQRARDQRFLQTFGERAWQDKCAQEGVVAYAFTDTRDLETGITELDWLSDVYFFTKPDQRGYHFSDRRRYYFAGKGREFTYGTLGLLKLVIDKPFPVQDYEQLLREKDCSFRQLVTYRLADLTDDQIRGYWRTASFLGGNVVIPAE